MKKPYLKSFSGFLAGCLLFLSSQGQSCLPGGIVFSRQSQIDSFPLNYPGCSEVAGTVLIKEAIPGNITNLDSLKQLIRILRPFTISDNSNLVDLEGLNNLVTLNQNFTIYNNKELSSISALNNLSRVVRAFEINSNPKLLTLTGLEKLKRVARLAIYAVPIKSLQGLDILETIDDELYISNCSELESLDGINMPALIINSFWFTGNGKIANLNNLPIIKHLERLHINFNQNLLSLNGLDSLTTVTQIDLENNLNLASIKGLKSLREVPVQLKISGNEALLNLDGLDSLKLCGRLLIEANSKLISIEALKKLTKVDFFRVNNNPELQTLSGLDNVDPTTIMEFEIAYNFSLSTCHVKSICSYFSLYPGSFAAIVDDNYEDCNSIAEVKAKCESILPSFISGLKIQHNGKWIKIAWNTFTEINNKGFEIQRSSNYSQWQTIGFVNGAVNSNQVQTYSYNDVKPSVGMVYYRLKQVDLDGKVSYSNVVNAKITAGDGLTILPNPASHFVEINGLEKAQVKVTDTNGRVLINQAINGNTNINISGLGKGLYFFEIITENTRTVKKIIKQ